MRSRGFYCLFQAMLIAVLTFSVVGCTRAGDDEPGEKGRSAAARGVGVGDKAPAFELKTFDHGVFRLSDKRGSPVVVNFWASWCGPCRFEAPVLNRAYEAFKDRGVAFIGVAVQDMEEESRAFIEEYGFSFPVGPDTTEEIMRAYKVFGIPKTFVIDSSGRISFVFTGAVSEEVLAREIERAL